LSPFNFSKNNNVFVWTSGLIVATVLFGFSIYFSTERALNFDSAYYLFHVLHQKNIFFPNGRFTAAIPQLPVLAGQKLTLSLNGIFILYSLSAFLLPWIAAVFFAVQQNYRWFTATLLSVLLFQSHAFLYPISDFRSGLPWLLLWAYSLRPEVKVRYSNALASALLLIPVIWSHPLMLIPFCFVWLLRLFNKPAPLSKTLAVLFNVNLIIIALRLAVFNTDYDDQKLQMPSATEFLSNLIPSLNISGGMALWPECLVLLLLLLLPATAFARFLLLSFFFGSLSLIMQTGQATVWDQYADHLLTGTAALMGIYAAHFISARHIKYLSFALLILLLTRSIQIFQYVSPAQQRLALYQNWIDQCRRQNIKHAWINCEDCDWPLWDSFYQTLLLSASKGSAVSLFISKDPPPEALKNANIKGWYDGGSNWKLELQSNPPLPPQDNSPLQFLMASRKEPLLKSLIAKP